MSIIDTHRPLEPETASPTSTLAIRDAARALRDALVVRTAAPRARLSRWAAFGVTPIGLLLLVLAFRHAFRRQPTQPNDLVPDHGWWAWYDQSKTLEALMAFRAGDFGSTHQWYPPLYALIGTAFSFVTVRHPFFLPNLAGLLCAFWLTVRIARAIGFSAIAGAAIFLLVTIGAATQLETWIEPWNTDLASPLILLGLLGAITAVSGTTQGRWGMIGFGVAFGLMPAIRPSDDLALLPAAALIAAGPIGDWTRDRAAALRGLVRRAVWCASGFVPAIAVALLIHIAIWGLHPSGYMAMSKQTGFEWRLIPLHWVTLVADPRPMFSVGVGLIEVYWWLPFAFAGVAAVLFLAFKGRIEGPRRRVHVMLIAAVALHWALYLSYRDLHPTGLWFYHNYHYFQWTMPLLGLYAAIYARLGLAFIGTWLSAPARPLRGLWLQAGLIGVAVMVLATCWRAQLSPVALSPDKTPILDPASHEIVVPGGLSSMRDVLLMPVDGPAHELYFGPHTLTADGRTLHHFSDFRVFILAGGGMLTPLRPLPHTPSTVHFSGALVADPSVTPRVMRMNTVFGLPCWVPRHIRPAVCADDAPLPGPRLPERPQIDFNSRMELAYLVPGGWSEHADGRWTLGYSSDVVLRLRDPATAKAGFAIDVEAAGFIPRGAAMLLTEVWVNGHHLDDWHVGTTANTTLRVDVPPGLVGPDGAVRLSLRVLNARRPRDYGVGPDTRLLGLRVRAIRVVPKGA